MPRGRGYGRRRRSRRPMRRRRGAPRAPRAVVRLQRIGRRL